MKSRQEWQVQADMIFPAFERMAHNKVEQQALRLIMDMLLETKFFWPFGASEEDRIADRIIEGIERDLLDRSGLDHALESCADDIRVEIRDSWREIILKALRGEE